MSERRSKALKSAKNWNMVLLVLGAISVVFGAIGIPAVLNPPRETYELLGMLDLYNVINTSFYKIYSIISLLISAGLLFFFVRAHLKLRKAEQVSDLPYFAIIAVNLISLVVTFLTARQTMVFSVIAVLVQCLFPIMVLVNLSKAEKEATEEIEG